MVKFEYVPTFKDFREVARLDRTVNLSNRAFHILMTWLGPIAGLIGIGLQASTHLSRVRVVNNYPLFDAGLVIVCFSAPFLELGILYSSFRSMFPAPTLKRSAFVGDDGIEVQIPGISNAKYEWNAFIKSAQNDNCVLLYVGKSRFLFFPMRQLSTAERAEFNDLVARRIVKR